MKIFFSAYTCKGNTGDVLINKIQIEEYARYGEVYVDCTGMPENFYNIIFDTNNTNIKDFVKTYGINYRSKNMLQALRLMQKEGFTHFTKSPGPYAYVKFPFKKFLLRLIGAYGYWMAHKMGMKVIALGIDLNYSNEPIWLQRLNNQYFSIYNILGIRSKNNVAQLSRSLTNVQYVPDMAFLYPLPSIPPINKNRKRIALSFRKVDDIVKLTGILNNICEFFTEKDYGVEIVYQVEEDMAFCKELSQVLQKYKVHFRPQIINYYQLDIYSQYAFVFSNRLHVGLMAAIYGAIPYAIISHHSKEQKLCYIFESVFSKSLWRYQEAMNRIILEDIYAEQKSLAQMLWNDVLIQRDLCKAAIKQCLSEFEDI